MSKIKLNIIKVSIDPSGELHIVTEQEEILFRKTRVKEILLDNSFQYKNQMHNLFEDINNPIRIAILETL
jgi:hypothetical protein